MSEGDNNLRNTALMDSGNEEDPFDIIGEYKEEERMLSWQEVNGLPGWVQNRADSNPGRCREGKLCPQLHPPREGESKEDCLNDDLWSYLVRGVQERHSSSILPEEEGWDECLKDVERYQGESFEDLLNSNKAIHMNFTLLKVWPFPEDVILYNHEDFGNNNGWLCFG